MKKVAYIYNNHFRSSHAGSSIARGFASAFKRLGYQFVTFDLTVLKLNLLSRRKKSLIDFAPDLIFASVEHIHFLPLDKIRTCNLVLWGQFYVPCSYENQIVTISSKTKNKLVRYRDKHRILIWSQHSDAINEQFFKGYQNELGLEFTQLLHCAERSQLNEPVFLPFHDFIWIGNIGHRKDVYNEIISPLKKASTAFMEFTEHNPVNPNEIFEKKYYRNAQIAINVHTKAQIKHSILLNERVFSSSLQGGFQICDNILARQFFDEDELLIASKPSDYMELLMYYKENPEQRLSMIKRMQKKILATHLYDHRINKILGILFSEK